jgi:F0F1-type ATP synthase membrane subunit b/b'
MTKAQELAILDATIAKLGPDSYLGPWLSEQRACIEADLAADGFMRASTLREAREQVTHLIDAARADAQRIRAEALAEATRLREAAQQDIDRARSYARGQLEQAIERLR